MKKKLYFLMDFDYLMHVEFRFGRVFLINLHVKLLSEAILKHFLLQM